MADFGHVGITVSDLERSAAFYRDVVGMAEVDRREFASEAFGRLTHNPGAVLWTALLRAGSFVLQLVEYRQGGGRPLDLDHRHPGSPHLSFEVDDVRAVFAALSAREDVEVASELVEILPGIHSFYALDPDGVPVELAERFPLPAEGAGGPSR